MGEVFNISDYNKREVKKPELKPAINETAERPEPKEKLDYEKLMELFGLVSAYMLNHPVSQQDRIYQINFNKIAAYSDDEIIRRLNEFAVLEDEASPAGESGLLFYSILLDEAGNRGLIRPHFEM